MKINIKNFFSLKSRFFFNIDFFYLFICLIKNIFQRKEKNFFKLLNLKFKNYFPNSTFHYYSHGRTAFYNLLLQLKKKTSKKKIIINSMTLFEMINVIIYSGFEPIFIDQKRNSFDTNLEGIFYKHKNQIAAIVITHLNGVNSNIYSIIKKKKFLNKNKIFLIEDCAVAFGSKYKNNNYCGSIGDFSILSFNIMKNITSITGGLLINNTNIKIFNKLKIEPRYIFFKKLIFVIFLKILNTKIFFYFFFFFIGFSYKYNFNFILKKYRTDFLITIKKKFPSNFNFKMNKIQSLILLNNLNTLNKDLNIRIRNAEYYLNNLNNIPKLKIINKKLNKKNIFLDFPVMLENKNIKNKLFKYLFLNFIDVKNYYYSSCSKSKIYEKFKNKCINADKISEQIIMLPTNKNFEKDDIMLICHHIKLFLKNYK